MPDFIESLTYFTKLHYNNVDHNEKLRVAKGLKMPDLMWPLLLLQNAHNCRAVEAPAHPCTPTPPGVPFSHSQLLGQFRESA